MEKKEEVGEREPDTGAGQKEEKETINRRRRPCRYARERCDVSITTRAAMVTMISALISLFKILFLLFFFFRVGIAGVAAI